MIHILVGGWATPLKNMSSSIGNKKWQPNHQPAYSHEISWDLYDLLTDPPINRCSQLGHV